MKKLIKNTLDTLNANHQNITKQQAEDLAAFFQDITKRYNAKVQKIKDAMLIDLEGSEQAKEFIKAFAKQEGDDLFGNKSSVLIIDGVKLTRNAQQPTVDLRNVPEPVLRRLIFEYPDAFKVDLKKLGKEEHSTLAPAIKDQEKKYTYLLKLVNENESEKKGK